MHGLLFISLRDYLAAVHGAAISRNVMADEHVYLLSEAYPDERFSALVERACEVTGLPPDTLLHDLGVFTAERTFVRLYPNLFSVSPSERAFLLTVERPIHEIVRVAIPHALPPQLAISESGELGISIIYSSTRQMCDLLRGLVEGTAHHYGETVHIEEGPCMKRGDQACTFEVRFEPS